VSPSQASGTLSLRLLGPPQIELDGAPVEVDTRKAIALLAYLAVTGQAHSREALAALLWPEYDAERAYANLRRTLWALNKALGKTWLDTEGDTVGLARPSRMQLDLRDFEQHLAECRTHGHPEAEVCTACLAPLTEATALYRGDFLAGFTLRDSPPFDEWQFFEAERLREALASALQRLVQGHVAEGSLAPAIDVARRWLALDPLREAAHRELMRLYAWDGRRTAALRQYEECVRILEEELGVPPEPETDQLHEAIQRNELPPPPAAGPPAARGVLATAPAPRHNLPSLPTPFVGRAPELAEITTLLGDPDCRLLALVGPGGVGKTRLALRAAEQALPAFPDGVFFVSLAPVESARFLVPTIAQALGFSFFQREGAEPRQQLLDYLREKGMLLLLDNFEHLVEGAGLLAELLGQAPGVKLLVTSRERLRLWGEWVFEVGGMRFPRDGDETPEAVAGYSAILLFLQHAGQAKAGFAPAEDEWPDLVRICRLLDGLPLGIELAAAWVRLLSCREIADEIEKGLDFLSTTLRDVPARHRSLRAVFDHSWQLLPPPEKAALARLSVFRGSFGRAAAQQVAGADLPLLASLVDKSLLNHTRSGRYGMHEAVRQYAADRREEIPGEDARVQDRHCQYYVGFLAQREDDLRGARQREALNEIAQDIENVRAAWRWAVAHAQVPALRRGATSLATFLQVRSLFQEGEEALGQAAAALEAARGQHATVELDRTLGLLLAYQAGFAHRLYKHELGRALLQRSLALLQPFGPGEELALANLWGRVAGLVENVAEEEELTQQGLDYFRSEGKTWYTGMALQYLSTLAQMRGDLEAARRHLQEAIAVQTQACDRWGMAFTLFELGSFAQHQVGDRFEAKRYFEESLQIRRELGDPWGMAICLDYIGYLAREIGQYDEAQQLHEESLSIAREIGDGLGVAGSLDNLGLVARDQGEYGEAQRLFEAGLAQRREVGRSYDVAISLRHMGDAARGLGDLPAAEQWYRESLEILAGFWEGWGSEMTLAGLAEVAVVRADYQTARQHLREALQICLEHRILSHSQRILVSVARLLAAMGQIEDAAGLLAFVQHHPASTAQAQERAAALLAQLASQLPAGRLEQARCRFAEATPEAVLQEALAEL
jgi:predicted ATPase/DNA-binding SARP family transcriptional activator